MDGDYTTTSSSSSRVSWSDEYPGDEVIEVNKAVVKTSEVAEKKIPCFAEVCSTKKDYYEKNISDLTLKKQNCETSKWIGFWTNPCVSLLACVELGIGCGGGLSLAILYNLYGGIALGVIGIVSSALTLLYSSIVYVKSSDFLKTIKKDLSRMEKGKDFLEVLVPFSEHIMKFLDLWDDFQHDPQIDKVKPLFEQFKQFQEGYAILTEKAVQLSTDENYKDIQLHFAKSANPDHPVFDNIAYLFLMESVCKLVKNGPLVEAWNQLKSTSITDIVSLSSNIDPWKSLGMQNPANAIEYVEFMQAKSKLKNHIYAESLQHCFKTALTYYCNIKENYSKKIIY
jgi:hypothetical protein